MPRLLTLLIFVLSAPASWAQDAVPLGADPVEQVHWALGAFFGTGWYQVDSNRSVFILRIPPSQTLREASLAADGERKLGIEIHYPVSLGLSKLEDIPDFIDYQNFSTLSFTPGLELEIPVNSRWSLRPNAHLGYGWESENKDSAWIWYGGIKSRLRLGDGRVRWSLLNALHYAGYKPQYQQRGQYGGIMTGLEFSQPLGSLELHDEPLYLNWHLTYDWYFDRLNFHLGPERLESFREQWEIGLALGKRGAPIRLWFMSFEHVGLAYRFSSNADFSAITLNFSSPFTN